MGLDLINNLFNNIKENKFIKNFIKELSNDVENKNVNCKNEEIPIIDDILSKNNFTTGNQNSVRWSLNNVILKYAQENSKNSNGDELYFLKNIKNDDYTMLKTENGKVVEIKANKKDLPSKAKVNDVLKNINDTYIIDNVATNELKEEIENMAKEILKKQSANLNNHRKDQVLLYEKDKFYVFQMTHESKALNSFHCLPIKTLQNPSHSYL